MPSQPSDLVHAFLHSSGDTSFSDAPLPEPDDPGNDTAGAPRHDSLQCMTSVAVTVRGFAGSVVGAPADVPNSFSAAMQPFPWRRQHNARFSTDQSWGLPAMALLQSNTGQSTPLCLQHQSCFCRDQLFVSPPAGILQSEMVVDVVVGEQPRLSCLQHHSCFCRDQLLVSAPAESLQYGMVVDVVVGEQPRPSCLQHHSFFDGAQAASQLFNAA
eukprot:CAMPEP_0172929010 /NCGR_PEP_ID=MMETSP1075-20121228/218264_1 /TAXON_ID=2916 /ORGANISM="Ceratium fusus, Strain PA161109" /LENGTH=213 /DNA_ID=CAMNT_0013790299 /DNA_START=1377 /DNA_END=2018 /DNA_ORIENTATION=-